MVDIDILTNYSIKDLAGSSMGTMCDGLELITLHFPSIARANGSSGDKLGSLPVIFGLNPSFFFLFVFLPNKNPQTVWWKWMSSAVGEKSNAEFF